uniref:LPS assembly lipoprotein LptE n=1 Tax=Flavobacterium sp. TaxID=239 RepID=UPI00404ACC1E
MRLLNILALGFILIGIQGCTVKYNFTGAGKIDADTFQVNYFQNTAELVEPGIERDFTLELQDIIQSQTNLTLVPSGGDLIYEGEITDFRITPMTATADQRAAQNRLTITVMLRFTHNRVEDDSYEKRYTFFYDYPAEQQLIGQTLRAGLDEIFERITQDIFNDSLAKW